MGDTEDVGVELSHSGAPLTIEHWGGSVMSVADVEEDVPVGSSSGIEVDDD